MPIKLGINGLGRIGRLTLRNVWDNPDFTIVAANSRSSATLYAHLIKYDSSYGIWGKKVEAVGNAGIRIDGTVVPLFHELDPGRVPWRTLGVDVVIESTGVFKGRQDSAKHLAAGAKKVVISSPADDADVTLVAGVNLESYRVNEHHIISAASCTSNCLAPIVKILREQFGVIHGSMVTVHAYTNDQSLVDAPHQKEDLRRARAAYESIIPTTTGAMATIGRLIPAVDGKLSGLSLRVPVMLPSVVHLSVEVAQPTSAEAVNQAFRTASRGPLNGILDVSDQPLVSIDYKKNPHAGIVDALSTAVTDRTLVTVVAWYDNEWGYVHQLVNLIQHITPRGGVPT